MLPTHAVGIDLGTTYSCIAYLNEHGEPVTIPNRDGELSTPSVVMFDDDQVIVGTEALRNSIRTPDRVVLHAKRYIGDLRHRWTIQGKSYSPLEISTFILKALLGDAEARIGRVERAVITVPAQFSDVQREVTAEAGRRAGLKHVDIINEPVAAALCLVLGNEGISFSELAIDQTIMVVDLGGGTFDLSLVRYTKDEVRVLASGGDLHLGGIDWNHALESAIAKQFQREFGVKPLTDRESYQALSLEVEQTKRSLSVRPRAALTCQHGGHRKTYQVELGQFQRLTQDLVDRMEGLTKGLLAEQRMGWARVDTVLMTGGASRMPAVREMLKRLSGRTFNTALSPDLSIAHGATYYAGMLLSNSKFAHTLLNPAAAARLSAFKSKTSNARALGVLIKDPVTGADVPHYIIAPNTPLPVKVSQMYCTVVENQPRVHLHILESGTAADQQYVELGACKIEPLPANLPAGSDLEVTIEYDEQARVHVSAKLLLSGQEARAEIVRTENLVVSALSEAERDVVYDDSASVMVKSQSSERATPTPSPLPKPTAADQPAKAGAKPQPSEPNGGREVDSGPLVGSRKPTRNGSALDHAVQPIPLCNTCGDMLDTRGRCLACERRRVTGDASKKRPKLVASGPLIAADGSSSSAPPGAKKPGPPPNKSRQPQPAATNLDEAEADFWQRLDGLEQ